MFSWFSINSQTQQKNDEIYFATTGWMTGFLFKYSLYFNSKACPIVKIKSLARPGEHSKMKQAKTENENLYFKLYKGMFFWEKKLRNEFLLFYEFGRKENKIIQKSLHSTWV